MPGQIKLMENDGQESKTLKIKTYNNSKECRTAFEELNDFIKKFGIKEKVYYFSIKSPVN